MPSSIDGGRCSHVDVCYINTNDFKRRYKRGLVITINITYINVFVFHRIQLYLQGITCLKPWIPFGYHLIR